MTHHQNLPPEPDTSSPPTSVCATGEGGTNLPPGATMKTCTFCGEAKPAADMHYTHQNAGSGRVPGITGKCKRCFYLLGAARVKRWRHAHPEKAKRVHRDSKDRWRNGRPPCVECGRPAQHVHHTTYAPDDHGIDLCARGHRHAHGQGHACTYDPSKRPPDHLAAHGKRPTTED